MFRRWGLGLCSLAKPLKLQRNEIGWDTIDQSLITLLQVSFFGIPPDSGWPQSHPSCGCM